MENCNGNGFDISNINLHPMLESAMRVNLVPYQEYLLQGSILNAHVDTLLQKLKGLCDNSEGPIEVFVLGYYHDSSYVSRGYLFKKGRMNIIVTKLKRMTEVNEVEDPYDSPYITGSHYIETSVIEPTGNQAKTEAEMKQFADNLKPLVYMGRGDQFAAHPA